MWVELYFIWLFNSIFTATDNQDPCNCSDELERCLPTIFCSTEDMISRFENCLKTRCCPHFVHLDHNHASRTVSGFYWIHLAIILNKFTLFKKLTPFFLMLRNKSNMNWFTLIMDTRFSIYYLYIIVPTCCWKLSNTLTNTKLEEKVV